MQIHGSFQEKVGVYFMTLTLFCFQPRKHPGCSMCLVFAYGDQVFDLFDYFQISSAKMKQNK